METGKPGLVSAPVQSRPVAARTERKMDIPAPLTAFYIHTVPALPPQPHVQPPAAAREPAALHLAVPPLYSKETLPFLTLHIAGGLQSYSQELSLAAAASTARPKLTGKHVCPHCGRDCMKPSVLEKHLRCHTGERPYPCTTCGVSFKTQSNLYKHRRTQAHARLSSESEHSSLGSQDSMSSSRESCDPTLSRDQSEESGSLERNATAAAGEIISPALSEKTPPARDPDYELNLFVPASRKTDANESLEQLKEREKQQKMGHEKPSLSVNRHLPIQRQEATVLSKQWESSASRGKSQSHESTDSGFSESSDHYPSPGSVLLDHSMDSLTESAAEHLEEPSSSCRPLDAGLRGPEHRGAAREQEQRMLEEHISKLISENSAVVEDKHLENVRPRKTVLSKQGSIDLPMPYTYKDSFHFDMRISKASNVRLHKNTRPGLYSSVPTQHSTATDATEHAPALTRSNSLPFSVSLLQPERSSPSSSHQSDCVTVVRKGSSGQINQTGSAAKPANQQTSNHRPLVRQTAVDCNHATDGMFANSSVEEACAGDTCGEQSGRKLRRKKSQKFAYNKWYVYGGGTFKKLYSEEKGDSNVTKGRKSVTNPEHEAQGAQRRSSAARKDTITTTASTINATSISVALPQPCYAPVQQQVSTVDFNQKLSHLHSSHSSLKVPLCRNLSLSALQLTSTGSLVLHKADDIGRAEGDERKHGESKLFSTHVPSESKKQRTDDKIVCSVAMETESNASTRPSSAVAAAAIVAPQQDTNLTYVNLQTHPKHNQLKAALFPACISTKGPPPCSPAPRTAKSSFLPKYQLKLPSAAEPDSKASQASDYHEHGLTSAPSSDNTPTSSKASEKQSTAPLVPPSVQTHVMKKANSFHSTGGLPVFPLTAATFCEAKTSVSPLSQSDSSTPAALCRQFVTTTAATTCVCSHNATSCNASTPLSTVKSAVSSGPRPAVTQNLTTTNITTTESDRLSAPMTASSPARCSSLTPSSPSSAPNPANRDGSASNLPVVSCQIVPFDWTQPAAPNVFHVHTADLQICLQIISDEQLALIEPQIERQAGGPEMVHSEALSSVNAESASERRDRENPGQQKETDRKDSTHSLNIESIKPPSEPNASVAEHSDSSQQDLRNSAESWPSEASGASSRPHSYSNVTAVAATVRSAGETAALLRGEKSGMSQTSEEERAPPLPEDQSGLDSQTPSDPQNTSVLSHSTVREQEESRQTLRHDGAACDEGTMQTERKASACENIGEESGDDDDLPLTVSSFIISNCKAPREANPHDPTESGVMTSEIPHSSTHANRDGLSDATPHQSQRRISSAHSDKHLAQFTSSSCGVHAERLGDVTATQSSSAEGAREQSDRTDWESNQSQEAAETEHQRVETRDRRGTLGREDGRMRSAESAAPCEKPESDNKHTADTTKQEGEERATSEQNPSAETHCGTSEPQMPQQVASTSSDLSSPASSPTGPLCSPPHELEMNPFNFSQHRWDISVASNRQTQMLCEATLAQQILPHAQLQSALSQIAASFQQTQPHIPDETQTRQQERSCAARRVHLNPHSAAASAGESANLSKKSILGSQTCATSPTALKLLSYSQGGRGDVSEEPAGMTGNRQASNTTPGSPACPEPDGQFDSEDQAACAHVGPSAQSAPGDVTDRCQSLPVAGQLHGYQPLECLRPLQSCQDYADDTSSSDDEGKLIIEL